MPEWLSLQDFVPHLSTRFDVDGRDGYTLQLADVTDLSNGRLEQFSLVFSGNDRPWLGQGSYRLKHPAMGDHELFLVPIGPDAAGMRYEAVFSRLLEPAKT